ncbi:MAG TPA: tRNA (adenine-N1)-methyltransferase [Acidimicrobiales bacterium]|nr:tRNA (adenine-N1)-methyltransferase [Acidimicrobiales bacterium]
MDDESSLEDRSRLTEGERVLMVDAKERRYLITLRAGTKFHTHMGIVVHDDLIGAPEGSTVLGSTGRRFVVVRPTLSDVVLKMPRGAQVIYPKDLAAILVQADIAPGMRVLEAGVGSGALSMALLRAGAEVIGYELREDFANRARSNVAASAGEDAAYRVELRDVYEGIDETGLDRIVLDLPEPWRVLAHARQAMRSGGIICAYLPTINQTAQFRNALDESPFGMAETLEVLHRTWHIEARSVRPDHRMVGHTGFLTTARLLVPPADSEPVETTDSEPVETTESADPGEASADPA